MLRKVSLDSRPYAFAEYGAHLPLLLVHGFPFDHAIWQKQLTILGAARRVIAPDLAGFGDTGMPGHADLDGHADDLAALLDELAIDRVVLGGLSMGGYIALAMWRRHAARIAGLVLADTRAAADTDEARAGRERLAATVAEDGVQSVVDSMHAQLFGPDATDQVRSQVRAVMLRQPADGVVAALHAMAARPDSTPDLAGIDVPCLVLVGEHDSITPPDEAQSMAEALPQARLAVIPRAGHLANFEEPGAVNGAVRAFLAAIDPG